MATKKPTPAKKAPAKKSGADALVVNVPKGTKIVLPVPESKALKKAVDKAERGKDNGTKLPAKDPVRKHIAKAVEHIEAAQKAERAQTAADKLSKSEAAPKPTAATKPREMPAAKGRLKKADLPQIRRLEPEPRKPASAVGVAAKKALNAKPVAAKPRTTPAAPVPARTDGSLLNELNQKARSALGG